MFGVNHSKLKTNLKLAIQRLKLLERKKSENAHKSTKEIADYIQLNKYDRAKIKVEHIIREDYLVEAMEIVEMYCDLLLARFGLVESMKEIDMGLYECVSSLIWVAPRMESECSELKVIAEELSHKYGKEFTLMCKENRSKQVNEKLMQKLTEQAPGDLLVEKYLVEIAKSHNVPYKPKPDIAIRDPDFFYNSIDHSSKGNSNSGGGDGGATASVSNQRVSHIGFKQESAKQSPSKKEEPNINDFIFPTVPESTFDTVPKVDDSYDDLAKRFENLKKK